MVVTVIMIAGNVMDAIVLIKLWLYRNTS